MDKEKELVEILANNFGLTVHISELDTESDYLKKIQILLSERIQFLISTDVEKLFQILYKVDVPQGQTDLAFDLGDIKKVSMKIAELIIVRQLKKIDYSRKFYGEKK